MDGTALTCFGRFSSVATKPQSRLGADCVIKEGPGRGRHQADASPSIPRSAEDREGPCFEPTSGVQPRYQSRPRPRSKRAHRSTRPRRRSEKRVEGGMNYESPAYPHQQPQAMGIGNTGGQHHQDLLIDGANITSGTDAGRGANQNQN